MLVNVLERPVEDIQMQMSIDVVKRDGLALRKACRQLSENKEFVLAAVKNNGRALYWASDELLSDKEVVLAAVKNDGSAIEFASHALQKDKDVLLASVKNNMYAIYKYRELQHDKDIFMSAVSIGYSLQFASTALRSDKAFILSLVKKNGMVLEFASDALKCDKDIIYAALTQNGNALWHLPLDILNEDTVLAYAKYSKCPAKLTPSQGKGLTRYVTQKKSELYGLYWIKRKYPGHASGVLTEIPTYLMKDAERQILNRCIVVY